MKKLINKIISGFTLFSLLILFTGCPCDEKAGFHVVRGEVGGTNCKELLKGEGVDPINDPPNVPIICPGESVTICFFKDNISKMQLTTDDGSINQTITSDAGVISFRPSNTTTVTLEPTNSCAPKVQLTIYVLDKAMDIPITGSWDRNNIGQNNCENVVFNLSETFVTPEAYAIEIMADWNKAKQKEAYFNSDSIECPTPPFLAVFRPDNPAAGQHNMPVPQQWEKLARGWKAAGQWAFVPEYINQCEATKNCDLRIDFPFFIYMSCDENEPYRQPFSVD